MRALGRRGVGSARNRFCKESESRRSERTPGLPTRSTRRSLATFLLGNGKYGLAQMQNLDRLPATGAVIIAPPLKIVNGSGPPVRIIALVERS